jgi:hypothetical protein
MKRFERDFKGKLFQKFSLNFKTISGDRKGRPYAMSSQSGDRKGRPYGFISCSGRAIASETCGWIRIEGLKDNFFVLIKAF